MKTEVLAAHVQGYGIKGRDRKRKFHVHHLGDFDPESVDKEAVLAEARTWMKLNLREPLNVALKFTPTTIEVMGGVAFRVHTLAIADRGIPLTA